MKIQQSKALITIASVLAFAVVSLAAMMATIPSADVSNPCPSSSIAPSAVPSHAPSPLILPNITITSPISGATLSGFFTINISANSPYGITGVKVKIDGQDFGTIDTTSPYVIAASTTGLSDGLNSITATAYDTRGQQGSFSIQIRVENASSPSPSAEPTPAPLPSFSASPTPHPSPTPSGPTTWNFHFGFLHAQALDPCAPGVSTPKPTPTPRPSLVPVTQNTKPSATPTPSGSSKPSVPGSATPSPTTNQAGSNVNPPVTDTTNQTPTQTGNDNTTTTPDDTVNPAGEGNHGIIAQTKEKIKNSPFCSLLAYTFGLCAQYSPDVKAVTGLVQKLNIQCRIIRGIFSSKCKTDQKVGSSSETPETTNITTNTSFTCKLICRIRRAIQPRWWGKSFSIIWHSPPPQITPVTDGSRCFRASSGNELILTKYPDTNINAVYISLDNGNSFTQLQLDKDNPFGIPGNLTNVYGDRDLDRTNWTVATIQTFPTGAPRTIAVNGEQFFSFPCEETISAVPLPSPTPPPPLKAPALDNMLFGLANGHYVYIRYRAATSDIDVCIGPGTYLTCVPATNYGGQRVTVDADFTITSITTSLGTLELPLNGVPSWGNEPLNSLDTTDYIITNTTDGGVTVELRNY